MVRFPNRLQAQKIMEGFRRIAGFPKVIGCGDGTFIRIKPPTINEADYVNRKGFHSLNVQMGDVMISNDVQNFTNNDVVRVTVQDRADGNGKRDELVRRFF